MTTVPSKSSTPLKVRRRDIGDFDQLDKRVSAVTVLFGSVFGVSDGSVEWCTDSDPPSEGERLAWIWLCWPHLDEQLMPHVRPDHRDLMRAYREGKLGEWWASRG
jgi:hypothetical protein